MLDLGFICDLWVNILLFTCKRKQKQSSTFPPAKLDKQKLSNGFRSEEAIDGALKWIQMRLQAKKSGSFLAFHSIVTKLLLL